MKRALLAVLPLMLVACNVNPTVITKADGTVIATTGGSVFSKSASESAEITKADGTTIRFSRVAKDEVSGVTDISRGILLTKLGIHTVDASTAVKHDAQVTQRAATAGSNAVKQSKIAADVTKSTFVPPPPTP